MGLSIGSMRRSSGYFCWGPTRDPDLLHSWLPCSGQYRFKVLRAVGSQYPICPGSVEAKMLGLSITLPRSGILCCVVAGANTLERVQVNGS